VGLAALTNSTLLKKLRKGDVAGAADEFPRWNKAGGKVLNGLVKRRAAERELFLAP
jgi:GH24 family phage-related lysozyme (muramidase)